MPHGATQSAEGSLRFSVDQDGRITHVAPELLDEVATVIWDSCVDKASESYRDDFPYADLDAADRDWMRDVARQALEPLARWMAAEEHGEQALAAKNQDAQSR